MSASETQIIACTTPSDACSTGLPPEIRNGTFDFVVTNTDPETEEQKAIPVPSTLIGAPKIPKSFGVNKPFHLEASKRLWSPNCFKTTSSLGASTRL